MVKPKLDFYADLPEVDSILHGEVETFFQQFFGIRPLISFLIVKNDIIYHNFNFMGKRHNLI